MSSPAAPLPRALLALLSVAWLALAPGCCRGGDGHRGAGGSERAPPPEHTAQTPTATALGTTPAPPGDAPAHLAPPHLAPPHLAPPHLAPPHLAPPEGGLPDEARALPASCTRRQEGTIGAFTVKIDEYKRLSRPGPNGVHELAEGTVVATRWALAPGLLDTMNVHLALNVASATDAAGLPREIALRPGESIELMGEYIPASRAHASNGRGPAAVIHFTHSPCGHVTIEGTDYK